MALIGNYNLIAKSPGQFRSGTTVSSDASNYSKTGSIRNIYAGEADVAKFNSAPSGGTAWLMAQTDGGLATFTSLIADISGTDALLASGINVDASLTAAIAITDAQLDQIVDLIASITGSISTTDALLAAVAGLQASITASMSVTEAQLGAIISMIASLTAIGQFTSADDFATAEIGAEISSVTELSPQSLAAAVWASVIDGTYSAEDVLRVLAAVAAGKTDITGTTVTFRSLSDATDVVVAEMTGSERTSITLDVTQ